MKYTIFLIILLFTSVVLANSSVDKKQDTKIDVILGVMGLHKESIDKNAKNIQSLQDIAIGNNRLNAETFRKLIILIHSLKLDIEKLKITCLEESI